MQDHCERRSQSLTKLAEIVRSSGPLLLLAALLRPPGEKPENGDERLGVGDAARGDLALQSIERDLDQPDVLPVTPVAAAGTDSVGVGHLHVVEENALRRSAGRHVKRADVV